MLDGFQSGERVDLAGGEVRASVIHWLLHSCHVTGPLQLTRATIVSALIASDGFVCDGELRLNGLRCEALSGIETGVDRLPWLWLTLRGAVRDRDRSRPPAVVAA